MAWNPSKEVAIARDVARQMDAQVVVIYLVRSDAKFGTITYGKTPTLCNLAKQIGDEMLSQGEKLDKARAAMNRLAQLPNVENRCGPWGDVVDAVKQLLETAKEIQ